MAAACSGRTTATPSSASLIVTSSGRAEDGELPFHLRTRALRTRNGFLRRENKLLEAVMTVPTAVLVNGHSSCFLSL